MIETQETEVRLPRDKVERLVEVFLAKETPEYPTYTLIEDGDTGWAFWIVPEDTTSYIHSDGKIQWLGSAWPEDVDYEGATGRFIEKQVPPASIGEDPTV